MARFWLAIHGDDLLRAMLLLNNADIPTIATSSVWHGDQPPQDLKLHRLTAVVDAENAEKAVARVKDNLPAGGNYTVSARDDDT